MAMTPAIAEGLLVDLVPYGQRFHAMEHRWLNDDGVFWWAVGGRWFATRAGLERERIAEADEPGRHAQFGLQTKDETPIGLIGINWLPPEHRTAMLTAFIGDPAYWGGGYGTDGLLLVIEHAFRWLDARRVWLMTMSLNARVMRQMDKVGFQLETRQRQATWAAGAWHDLLIYTLDRDDWPGRDALIARLGLRAR